jgi:hypothetical protein
MPESLIGAGDPIVLAYVFLQTPDGELTFLFCEPFCRSWEVREDEICTESDDHGYGAFNDEHPAPERKVSVGPIRFIKESYQARKPRATVKPFVMPAVMRPEKAPDINEPEYIIAVRRPSSFLVYQDERKKSTPGYSCKLLLIR